MTIPILSFLSILSSYTLALNEGHQITGIYRPQRVKTHPKSNADLITGERRNRQLSEQEHGQETSYEVNGIENDNSTNTPGEVQIDIINPKPASGYWYTVTIEIQHQYTGTAMLISEISEPTIVLRYSWTPPFRGDFKVIVHELPHRLPGDFITIPSWESHVLIHEKPGFDSITMVKNRMKHLPPCQTVKRNDVYTTWDGHWLSNREGMLNHWYFLPGEKMQCRIEYFSRQDLSLNTETKSIYILGDSKHRGIFLSLVDLLLSREEKQHLHRSFLSNCWGRTVVTKFNLSVMYQDWRTYFEIPGAEPNILCHNDIVIREGNSLMLENGLKVFEEIFRNKASWPSVILLVSGMMLMNGVDQTQYDILQLFLSTIPQGWTGTLFLIDDTFCAHNAGRGNVHHYERYNARLRDLTSRINDKRVRWLDGLGISKEMRMYGEYGPDHTTYSQHFHRACDELFHDDNFNTVQMKICSNTTLMLSHLMLDHALGPKDEFLQKAKRGSNSWFNFGRATIPKESESELFYCNACPANLIPMHITPYPNMTCDSGALHPRQESDIHDKTVPASCPEECLKNEPVTNTRQTQSGVVEERVCPTKNTLSKDSDHLHDHGDAVSMKRSAVVANSHRDLNLPFVTSRLSLLTMVIAVVSLVVFCRRGRLGCLRNKLHSSLD